MESLWPGSWINGNYDTWIGEKEENTAWEYLLRVRKDLESSGIRAPAPSAPVPKKGTRAWYAYKAWESMYASEGSDWFWWYGTDQGAPGGDAPFDAAFRIHLKNVYTFARRAGAAMPVPDLPPIITAGGSGEGGQGTMAPGGETLQDVTLVCDATAIKVTNTIYVAGNHPELGNWNPNTIPMYDDGTHGDRIAGDGKWTLRLKFPAGTKIEYKYTNSGLPGVWTPSEEFAGKNRSLTVLQQAGEIVVHNEFGR
jgi:hypothetical protein